MTVLYFLHYILHIQHNGNVSIENSIIQSITYGNLRIS